MSENKSADWDWSEYFDKINDPPMRGTVQAAIDVLGLGQGRPAIDLGCGHGNDTVHMLNAGFEVLAMDTSAEGLRRLQNRADLEADLLSAQKASFHTADWKKNIWTNAGFALPFCPSDKFDQVWQRISENLQDGGIFSGQLFGIEDSWNGKVSDMNFHSEESVRALCNSYGIMHFEEEKGDGKDAVGRPKYWHIFHIVLQKKSK